MKPEIILGCIAIYFLVLLFIAWYTSRNSNNETFFRGNKQSPWLIVAYGMIGTSLSGVTFMSVPGEVFAKHFMYMQVVLGYFLGYFAVAFILLPLYYRMNLTSIYSYLQTRFGNSAYKTGASFFLLSRTLGASIRIFLVLIVLQNFVLTPLGIPFIITVLVILLMILLYTFNGGVKTIVWTDMLQTTGMLLALIITIFLISAELNFTIPQLIGAIHAEGMTQTFQLTDWKADSFFLKQILGGAFVTIAMTGLDQEMMQKNISVRTLGESQKNMMVFSVILVLVNLLFLILGGALYIYMQNEGIAFPEKSDATFSTVALNYLPAIAGLIFIIGLVSALFPSADGALTALTSSFCIDILGFNEKKKPASENNSLDSEELKLEYVWDEKRKLLVRRTVHISITILFVILIMLYQQLISGSVISTILKVAGYTYGPLLGLFAFGIFTKRKLSGILIPVVCVTAPVVIYFLAMNSEKIFCGYKFGFELLLVNGILTFMGLFLISKKNAAE